MRYLFLSASLLLIAVSTYAQTENPLQPCSLKLSQAPAVRGPKLGMTVDEILSLFPGSSDSANVRHTLSTSDGYPRFGDASFSISPSEWGNKDRFAGISSYFFRFFDQRLVGFAVYYDSFPQGARWKNADDLIQKFSDPLHLPGPNNWAPDPDGSQKRLKCNGFEVTVSTSGDRGTINIYNRSWVDVQRERLAAFEDKKRLDFKP